MLHAGSARRRRSRPIAGGAMMRSHVWWVLGAMFGLALSCSANDSASVGSGGGGGSAGLDASAGTSGSSGDAAIEIEPAETLTVIGPGADVGSPDKFDGPSDPSGGPSIVYPANDVVFPANLSSLEIHFTPALGQTLFEIRFLSAAIELLVYTGCTPVGAGCVFETDATFWEKLAGKNRGTQPVSWRIRGVNAASPGSVGTSETRAMAFSGENIIGGLYYWNTNGSIQRYDFGAPLQTPELYMSAQQAGALACVGCHALSRDGKAMAIGRDIPAPAPFTVHDVATRQPLVGTNGVVQGAANFFAFSPDSKQLLFSNGIQIGVMDVATGDTINPTLVPLGTMPDWSPNGKLIVYSKPSSPPPLGVPIPGVQGGSLETIEITPSGLGAPKVLVPFQGANNYYPAFSPTQSFIVFNRSPSNTESFSNAPPAGDGELWAVDAESGALVRLDNASAGGSTSWPKWAPDVQTYWDGTIMWLTFSTGRPYGLRLSGGTVQLWMVGFDPKRAAAGKDPSLPPFWFPYQDQSSGNHIAQWVTQVERQPCVSDTECQSGEFCKEGKCYPIVY
jgi:hypothetical protein